MTWHRMKFHYRVLSEASCGGPTMRGQQGLPDAPAYITEAPLNFWRKTSQPVLAKGTEISFHPHKTYFLEYIF